MTLYNMLLVDSVYGKMVFLVCNLLIKKIKQNNNTNTNNNNNDNNNQGFRKKPKTRRLTLD